MLVCSVEKARELSPQPEIDIRFISKAEVRTSPSMMPEAPALAVMKLLDRTGLKMDQMAVVKNHNPFAVNDAIFASQMDYDWKKMNNNGCVVRDRGRHAVGSIGIENHLALNRRSETPCKDVVDPPRVATVQV